MCNIAAIFIFASTTPLRKISAPLLELKASFSWTFVCVFSYVWQKIVSSSASSLNMCMTHRKRWDSSPLALPLLNSHVCCDRKYQEEVTLEPGYDIIFLQHKWQGVWWLFCFRNYGQISALSCTDWGHVTYLKPFGSEGKRGEFLWWY